jgi:predicted ATPase
LEQGIALYDPQQHRADRADAFLPIVGGILHTAIHQQHRADRADAFLYGQDPVVVCLSWATWALWYLGYPDQALKRSHETLILAHELAHPYSLATALHFAAAVHRLRREGRAAQERAEAVIALASEQGFPHWLAGGTFLRGWALAEQGQGEEGIAQMRQGIAAWRALGVEQLGQPFVLLAEVCGKAGQTEEGLHLLATALAEVQKSGERWWEAELYRLKGELTLAQSRVQSLESRVQNPQSASARIFHWPCIPHSRGAVLAR